MSATTNFSPILSPAAPVRGTWRGRLAGWLARLTARRQRMQAVDLSIPLGDHLRHDLGLPPGPSHDDCIWGVGGLTWR
jgi:hypothetical protein